MTFVTLLTAGDHGVHSHIAVLRLHRADGVHILAADRHDWILLCVLVHPQDLRRHQDRLMEIVSLPQPLH